MDTNPFKTTLEQIAKQTPHTTLQALCQDLIKSSNCKGAKYVEKLCDAVYWLYIYGQEEQCLALMLPTHEIEYSNNGRIVNNLHPLWALEIRILRARGEDGKAARHFHL